MATIPNFVNHDNKDGTMLYGAAAMKEILDQLEAKVASNDDDGLVGLSDVEPLQLYSFALDAKERARIEALVFAVLGSSSGSLAQQQSSSSSSLDHPSRKRKAELDLGSRLFD